MKTIELKEELNKALNYLRVYKLEKPEQTVQIAYLTMQANYLIEQIRGSEFADRILSQAN